MNENLPGYIKLAKSGELRSRVKEAYSRLQACRICAQTCKANRLGGELGKCRTGKTAMVSSYGPHLGEEAPLRGTHGSGTIFFTRCNLNCQYCQNSDISQTDRGSDLEPEEIAAIMLELQNLECHNINFVSPSHVVPQILAAVLIAGNSGLRIPLVYNTGGYDSIETLELLENVIDIYMPDMKYASSQIGLRYSKASDYPKVNQAAVQEMHRQVGDLQVDHRGIAFRGLLVRHLVLPNQLAGTEQIVNFIAQKISLNTYLNLMDQYRPAFKAAHYQKLSRPVYREEFEEAVELARIAGLNRLDTPGALFF